MRKLFYLKYGYAGKVTDIVEFLESKFDFNFTQHESHYFGIYFLYSGLHADKLTVGNNLIAHRGECLDIKNIEYETIVDVQIINGKNKDKLSKYRFLKKLLSGIKDLSLIKDEVIEVE